MKKLSGFTLLCAASMGAAGLALAAEGTGASLQGTDSLEVRSQQVRYDASGLDDPKEAERLFFRIRQAAAEVCSIASHPVGYERWEENACERDAVAVAVEDADVPALDDYYANIAGGLLD